ncbi:MAG: fimbrillin family protein [Alistipes sp.]|nr:fimbrillin family protein [Alistipes sp.]
MKRIFIAAALLGLFACNREDVVSENDLTPTAISFNNVATRAGLTDLQTNGFGVWATTSSTANNSAAILTNEKVYMDGGLWTYDNTRYWVENCKFYFLAVWPYSEDNSPVTQHDIVQDGVNYTGYTMAVTTPAAADYDPLVATNVTDTTVEGYATTVPLTFEHLMCKVNLKIEQDFDKTPDFDYYVSKVTVTGIKGSGTLFAMPYGDTVYRGWDFTDATNINFEKSYTTPVRLRDLDAEDKSITLTVFGDGLLLIPQEITASAVRVTVEYYYDVNKDDSDYGDAKSVDVFIPASADLWQSNKSIAYKLAIAESNEIKFLAPTIESWGAPQTGGTIIIK